MIGNDWDLALENEYRKAYFKKLRLFYTKEYMTEVIYPPEKKLFNAFRLTPYKDVSVVILGQDPYHGAYQAHGLSFSIADVNAKFPPSLRNIFKELEADTGIKREERNLTSWAEQGVLLLNTVLTVRDGSAGSHRKKGWEQFTDAVITALNEKDEQIVFILWGNDAKKKSSLLTNPLHKIISSAHPSPLSVRHGFYGSKPFSTTNAYLSASGRAEIKW